MGSDDQPGSQRPFSWNGKPASTQISTPVRPQSTITLSSPPTAPKKPLGVGPKTGGLGVKPKATASGSTKAKAGVSSKVPGAFNPPAAKPGAKKVELKKIELKKVEPKKTVTKVEVKEVEKAEVKETKTKKAEPNKKAPVKKAKEVEDEDEEGENAEDGEEDGTEKELADQPEPGLGSSADAEKEEDEPIQVSYFYDECAAAAHTTEEEACA